MPCRTKRQASLSKHVRVGVILAAVAALAACGSSTAVSSAPSLGSLALTEDVTIFYLGHCGYGVWTGRRMLIFDYSEFYERPPANRSFAQGYVNPTEIQDRDVTALATHNHIDHYDPVIRTWASTIGRIEYVFGWAAGSAGVHSLSEPRATLSLDGVDIYTVYDHHDDTDEVAFQVSADGLVVFHGGDYQGRATPTAPMTVREDMRYLFSRTGRPDLLFIDAWIDDPILQIIEELDPKIIFPMHWGGQESRYLEFASALRALGVTQPIICPTRRGDRYIYRDGQIVGP